MNSQQSHQQQPQFAKIEENGLDIDEEEESEFEMEEQIEDLEMQDDDVLGDGDGPYQYAYPRQVLAPGHVMGFEQTV